MSIFTSIFRSRDKPQDRTAGSGYSFFMGSSTSGKQVTERSAMQMTAVYSSEDIEQLTNEIMVTAGQFAKRKGVVFA